MTKFDFWFGLFLFVSIMGISSRLSYIAGMQSEKFDREHANKKLQDCIDVIVKK